MKRWVEYRCVCIYEIGVIRTIRKIRNTMWYVVDSKNEGMGGVQVCVYI